MTVTLYALEGCPACKQVSEALDDHEVQYEVHWVDERYSKREEVKSVSGQRAVPVLEDDDRAVVMADADRILEYVQSTLA
ncbi:MAG: glutaredoxin family protein [Halodesulfurarchaeum sp.]